MAGPYEIPYQPFDLSSGLDALRSAEYLKMEKKAVKDRAERESAALKRQEEQDKYNRSMDFLKNRDSLIRTARKSPELASNNPWGATFTRQEDLAPGVEGPELSPAAETARAMLGQKAGADPFPQQPQTPTGDLEPVPGQLPEGVEGPNTAAVEDAQREQLMQRAQEGVAPVDEVPIDQAMAMASANAAGQKSRLFMTYGGHRAEIPEQSNDTTPFGEKYDAVYQWALDHGATEKEANKAVLDEYNKDNAEAGRNTRAGNQIDFRNKNREDQQTFQAGENAKYKLTFEQRKTLAEIMARAKTAAAGAGPVPAGLAELVRMAESGAQEGDLWQKANELHLNEKQVLQPIQNVVKNASTRTRAQEKYAGTEVTDETGQMLGHAHNSQQANALKKQIDQFAQAKVRLHELIEDIRATGPRVLTPEELQNRLSKAQSVAAAMRVYNGLGATDASQKLESDIMGAIGTPGHGWLLGANLGVVERILHEAEQQHQVRIHTALRAGGGQPLPPALGGHRQQEGSQSGAMSDDEAVNMARQRLRANPNDSVARQVLQLHGLAQ